MLSRLHSENKLIVEPDLSTHPCRNRRQFVAGFYLIRFS
jgi:hypothetical protein